MSVTNPFQTSVNLKLAQGAEGDNVAFNVPQGKRLVIEYVSGFAFLPPGQTALFSVFPSLAGQTSGTQYYLPTFPSGHDFVTSQAVRLYADPGTSVMLRIDRDAPNGEGTARMSISGQLIAAP